MTQADSRGRPQGLPVQTNTLREIQLERTSIDENVMMSMILLDLKLN